MPSHAPSSILVDGNNEISPELSFLQYDLTNFIQLFLVHHMLRPCHHLGEPPQDLLQYITVSHNGLQMPPQKQTLPALFLLLQPGMQVTFSTAWAHSNSWFIFQILVHQHPTPFSAKLLSRHTHPSLHYCSGLFYPRCRTLNLPVSNFKRFPLSPFLGPIPLNSTHTTQNTNHFPQFGLTKNLREILSHHPRHQEILLNGIILSTSPLSMPLKIDFPIGLWRKEGRKIVWWQEQPTIPFG